MSTENIFGTVSGLEKLDVVVDLSAKMLSTFGTGSDSEAIFESFLNSITTNCTGKLKEATATLEVFLPLYHAKQNALAAKAKAATDATDNANAEASWCAEAIRLANILV